jgi:hypothetical protein
VDLGDRVIFFAYYCGQHCVEYSVAFGRQHCTQYNVKDLKIADPISLKNIYERLWICKSSKKWWILTFLCQRLQVISAWVLWWWWQYLDAFAIIPPVPLVLSSWTSWIKLLWWRWCHTSELTVNLIKPSHWIIAEDVAVRAIAARSWCCNHIFCVRCDEVVGWQKSSLRGTV